MKHVSHSMTILRKRVIIWSAILAVISGFCSYLFEIEHLEGLVARRVAHEAELFSQRVPAALQDRNKEVLKKELTAFLEERKDDSSGFFLMMEIYTPEKIELAKISQAMPVSITRQIDGQAHRFPKDTPYWYRKIFSDNSLYIQVVAPIIGKSDLTGYFEGVYSVSSESMSDLRNSILSSSLFVVIYVMASSIIMFPVISSLYKKQVILSGDLLQANIDTLSVLGSAIAKRDNDTHAHNFRVSLYAVRLAEALALPPGEICTLIKGALLHDVGKIAISDSILLKPGRLTEAEFAVMKTHVSHGEDIVRGSAWLTGAAEVVSGHHEKFNGTGYPRGLAGYDIPLNARIFALADVFDALVSRRPYKQPMTVSEALDIMQRDRGTHFSPDLFDVFARISPDCYASFGQEDDRAETILKDSITHYFFHAA